MSLSVWAWPNPTWCEMTYEQVKMAAFADELTKLALNVAGGKRYAARLAARKKVPVKKAPGDPLGGTEQGGYALIGSPFEPRYFRIGR